MFQAPLARPVRKERGASSPGETRGPREREVSSFTCTPLTRAHAQLSDDCVSDVFHLRVFVLACVCVCVRVCVFHVCVFR